MMLEWLMELNGDKEMEVIIYKELKGWLLLLLGLGDTTNNPAQRFMHLIKGKEKVGSLEYTLFRVQLLG